MDGLIGSVDDRFTLALFGFVVATGALSLRWWQVQRAPLKLPEHAAIVYLAEEKRPWLNSEPQPHQDAYPEIPDSDQRA